MGVPANRIICGLFGVAPSLWLNSTGREPATSFLRDAATPRGFDGKLSALKILGKLYTCGKRGRWAINRAGMIAATAGPSCTAARGHVITAAVQGPGHPCWLGLHFWKY